MKTINLFTRYACIGFMIWGSPLLFSGCAGQYDDVQLTPNTWRVSYRGAAQFGRDRIGDFALMRAAWLCNKNGYPWMIVSAQREEIINQMMCHENDIPLLEIALIVSGMTRQVPGALNSAFLLSSLTNKYHISQTDLER